MHLIRRMGSGVIGRPIGKPWRSSGALQPPRARGGGPSGDLVNGELVVTDLVPTEMSPIVATTEIDRPADEVFADALRRMAEVRHRRQDRRTGNRIGTRCLTTLGAGNESAELHSGASVACGLAEVGLVTIW